jgi:hypothetical protein
MMAPRESGTVEQPAPTAWPMVMAFAITLGFAGLVTHAIVSVVGVLLTVAAGVGWWRQVLPETQVEHIPVPSPAERVIPILSPRLAVGGLALGEAGHRMRIPVDVQPVSAGIKGGMVGGAAMAVIALAYGAIVQRSMWYPVNLLAAVAMPRMAQATTAELHAFDRTAFVLGTITHASISVLAGLLYAVILPMLPRRRMLWGGLVAPILWTGFVWAMLGVINPVLNARVDWAWFVASQIVYGLATGYVVARAEPIGTMQTWPLAARAGVEVSDGRPEAGR